MKDSDLEFASISTEISMIRTIRAVLPGMLAKKDGAIVNIASVASSIKGVPNASTTPSPRPPVIGLTKSVAADYVTHRNPHQRHLPGTVESPSLQDRMRAQGDYDAARAAFIAAADGPAGHAEEIAETRPLLAGRPIRPGRPMPLMAAGRSEKGQRDENCCVLVPKAPKNRGFWPPTARSATSTAMLPTCRVPPLIRPHWPTWARSTGQPAGGCRQSAARALRGRHRQVHLHRAQLFRHAAESGMSVPPSGDLH